ncbi:unnamed protein product, partial [Amoebophrya sp. A120]|eukprot:GSA120T00002137001.1
MSYASVACSETESRPPYIVDQNYYDNYTKEQEKKIQAKSASSISSTKNRSACCCSSTSQTGPRTLPLKRTIDHSTRLTDATSRPATSSSSSSLAEFFSAGSYSLRNMSRTTSLPTRVRCTAGPHGSSSSRENENNIKRIRLPVRRGHILLCTYFANMMALATRSEIVVVYARSTPSGSSSSLAEAGTSSSGEGASGGGSA